MLVFPIAKPAQIHNARNSHASVLVSLILSVKAESAGKVRNIRKSFINILSGRRDKKWGRDYCRTWNRHWIADKIMSLILRCETWTCCASVTSFNTKPKLWHLWVTLEISSKKGQFSHMWCEFFDRAHSSPEEERPPHQDPWLIVWKSMWQAAWYNPIWEGPIEERWEAHPWCSHSMWMSVGVMLRSRSPDTCY